MSTQKTDSAPSSWSGLLGLENATKYAGNWSYKSPATISFENKPTMTASMTYDNQSMPFSSAANIIPTRFLSLLVVWHLLCNFCRCL
jgi:hypothetical protein